MVKRLRNWVLSMPWYRNDIWFAQQNIMHQKIQVNIAQRKCRIYQITNSCVCRWQNCCVKLRAKVHPEHYPAPFQVLDNWQYFGVIDKSRRSPDYEAPGVTDAISPIRRGAAGCRPAIRRARRRSRRPRRAGPEAPGLQHALGAVARARSPRSWRRWRRHSGRGDRRGPPDRLGRPSGARVDDVMQRAAAPPPAARGQCPTSRGRRW